MLKRLQKPSQIGAFFGRLVSFTGQFESQQSSFHPIIWTTNHTFYNSTPTLELSKGLNFSLEIVRVFGLDGGWVGTRYKLQQQQPEK